MFIPTATWTLEALGSWRDQYLFDRGQHIALAVDTIHIPDPHDPLLDRSQFIALRIFKAQVLSQTERFPINEIKELPA
jgi:hypothetical protein